jgi:hypothetical protein
MIPPTQHNRWDPDSSLERFQIFIKTHVHGAVVWTRDTVKTIATEIQPPIFTEIKAVYVTFQLGTCFQ